MTGPEGEKLRMGEPPSIEELVRSRSAEGSTESHGTFTLDSRQARRKLREFALKHPQNYVLLLVGAVIGGGCSYVDIYTDSDDFILSCDLRLDRDHLEQLFSLPDLRKLALGLDASCGLKPGRVRLTTWDGSRGWRLELTDADSQVEAIESRPWEDSRCRVRIHVREKPGWRTAKKFLGKLSGQLTPEQELIRERCASSRVPITLNGEQVNPGLNFGDCLGYVRWGGDGSGPRVEAEVCRYIEADFEAHLALSRETSPGWAELVISGVSFQGWPLRGERHLLVYADQLELDASLQNVVENETYESLRAKIQEQTLSVVRSWLAEELKEHELFITGDGPVLFEPLERYYEENRRMPVRAAEDYKVVPIELGFPVILLPNALADLLFPEQVSYVDVHRLLPPGEYLVRYLPPSPRPELGLSEESSRLATEWPTGGRGGDIDPRRMIGSDIIPACVVFQEGLEPEQQDLEELFSLALKEKKLLGPAALDYLIFRLHQGDGFHSNFETYLETLSGSRLENTRRLVAGVNFPTAGGGQVSLQDLVEGRRPVGRHYTERGPILGQLPDELVLLPSFQFQVLRRLADSQKLRVSQDPRHAMIDRRGRLVCEPETVNYGQVMKEGKIALKVGSVWGYADGNGELVIKPQFSYAFDFDRGCALARLDEPRDYVLIDGAGERLCPPCELQFVTAGDNGLWVVARDELHGFMDVQGNLEIPCRYKSARNFHQGRAIVSDERGYFFIDTEGRELYRLEKPLGRVYDWKNSLLRVSVGDRHGVLHEKGHWVVEPAHDSVTVTDLGIVVYSRARGCAFLDRKGKTIFEAASIVAHGESLLAVEESRGEWSYRDPRGSVVFSGFSRAGAFSEGLAPACRAGSFRWGYIDLSGEFVVEPWFIEARPFSEERAVVGLIALD